MPRRPGDLKRKEHSAGAAIGGVKVVAKNGWFAARPSGAEDIYKIYAESFSGDEHLKKIEAEAEVIVARALATGLRLLAICTLGSNRERFKRSFRPAES
jgi:hypothetical protein